MHAEYTLREMTEMVLSPQPTDPIYQNQYTTFANPNNFNSKIKPLSLKENNISVTPRSIPSRHYIESQFLAYNKAKYYNRSYFTSSKIKTLSESPIPVPKFKYSRYPEAPLTKELGQKVKFINSFRYICKTLNKKQSFEKTLSNPGKSQKPVKPYTLLSKLESWRKLKKNIKLADLSQDMKPAVPY